MLDMCEVFLMSDPSCNELLTNIRVFAANRFCEFGDFVKQIRMVS